MYRRYELIIKVCAYIKAANIFSCAYHTQSLNLNIKAFRRYLNSKNNSPWNNSWKIDLAK